MTTVNPAREQILENARLALGRRSKAPVPPVPSSARVAPRIPGDANAEIDLLLGEIRKLGGTTSRLSAQDVKQALGELVRAEGVKKATLWQSGELQELRMAETLEALGVEIVSPHAPKRQIAECDLGVTGVDAAFPETGTLLLRSTAMCPRLVSLAPRIHLALVHPAALWADLAPALAEFKGDGYFVFVTGPSRTADIELTVTIGVHGPKTLYVWALDELA